MITFPKPNGYYCEGGITAPMYQMLIQTVFFFLLLWYQNWL